MQCCGHQLCHHIGLCVGKVQSPSHIADRSASRHGAKGGNLRHVVSAVFTHHIVDNLAAALLAEVCIKVGHTHPFRVQKALKNQRVFHRVHFRDVHTVCHNGGGAGATSRSDGDPVFFGVANKIPYDEVIVHIAHTANNTDLILKALPIALRGIRVALRKAICAELPKIRLIGISLGYREGRQMVLVEHKLHIAPICYFGRIFYCLRTGGKQLPHFLLALEVKLFCFKAHTVGVINGLTGLNAQQHVLHFGIGSAKVVGIICSNERQSGLSCNAQHALIDRLLLCNAVILKLQVKVVRSKNLAQA